MCLPGSFFNDDMMMMILSALCSIYCRIPWLFLKQNYHMHLTLFSLVVHILEKWLYMLLLGCFLIGLPSSRLLGICYDNLQYKYNFCFIGRTWPHQPPPTASLEHHSVAISLWLCLLNFETCWTVSIWVSMSVLMPIQYMDLHASTVVFSSPIWLFWPVL